MWFCGDRSEEMKKNVQPLWPLAAKSSLLHQSSVFVCVQKSSYVLLRKVQDSISNRHKLFSWNVYLVAFGWSDEWTSCLCIFGGKACLICMIKTVDVTGEVVLVVVCFLTGCEGFVLERYWDAIALRFDVETVPACFTVISACNKKE